MLETLIAIAVAVLAALGYGYHQRRAGAKTEREKQDAREAKARTIADEIDDAVAGRSPDENRKELARWSKP